MIDPGQHLGLQLDQRTRLARYEGADQFSHVYEAEILSSMGRPVGRCAVKVYQLRTSALVDEVMDELKAVLSLKHPGLVTLQSAGELEGEERHLYLTSEWTSLSLGAYLAAEGQMPEEEVRNLARGLAEGLDYLHTRRRYHGELRPDNVVQSVEVWKLSDYELARIKANLVRLEAGSDTLHYSAPEQLLGRAVPASDIWSLACILHEALTSQHPFGHLAGLSPADIAYHAEQGPELDDGLSKEWKQLFQNCLRHEPAQRWTLRQLLNWLEGRAPIVREDPTDIPHHYRVPMEVKPYHYEEVVEPVPEPIPARPAATPLPPPPRPRRSLWDRLYLPAICVLLASLGMSCWTLYKMMNPAPSASPTAATPVKVTRPGLRPVPFEAPTVGKTGAIKKSQVGEAQGFAQELKDAQPIEMIQVPAGEFTMGAAPNEPEARPEERPPHKVKLDAFFIGRREITQEQWAAVAGLPQVKTALVLEPSESRGEQLPVDSVSYDDCLEFCRRLSKVTKRDYRLPTEAEWEYACRAGTASPFAFGPTLSPEVAVYNATQTYGQGPVVTEPRLVASPVGDTGASNMFGLLDMHGNVEEWCQDFYAGYSPGSQTNPRGPASGQDRVLRGGGFNSYARDCRSAARAHARPGRGSNSTGFRIACDQWEFSKP